MMTAPKDDGFEAFEMRLLALADMVQGFTLTPQLVAMYDKHLSPLGYDRVCQALEQVMVERGSRDPFPSIKEIRGLVEPTLDPDAEAREIALRMVRAVRSCGDDEVGQRRAREMIGEEGWRLVQSEGGFSAVIRVESERDLNFQRGHWERVLAARLRNPGQSGLPAIENKPSSEMRKLIPNLKMPTEDL
jgi:hypothetical protein